jgi:hypothetical protein
MAPKNASIPGFNRRASPRIKARDRRQPPHLRDGACRELLRSRGLHPGEYLRVSPSEIAHYAGVKQIPHQTESAAALGSCDLPRNARVVGFPENSRFPRASCLLAGMLEAWAGQKSFKRKDGKEVRPPSDDDPGNPTVDFHGERRSNQSHHSTTDPEAQLARKGPGKEAKLSFAAHALMDNRHGLAVGGCVNQATGRAEVEAALALVEQIAGWGRVTLGADKVTTAKSSCRNCASTV